jgi:transmembrane protein 132
VKYGSFSGSEQFTVWMPKIPLHIELDDIKLSQIKSWRVPSDTSPTNNPGELLHGEELHKQYFKRKKRSKSIDDEEDKHKLQSGQHSDTCSPRYQQTKIRVFAEFLAEDPDSGRKEYFPSRSTQLDVTELVVKRSLRIVNSRIAILKGDILQGRSPGKTDVKVNVPNVFFVWINGAKA